jgi:putative methylase
MNKKELEIVLSSLENFFRRDVKLEQYSTPSDIAGEVLWDSNVVDKKVADLGCGNGIFGIGALILGAKNVIFLDIDEEALKVTKRNVKFIEKKFNKKFNVKFVNSDVVDFDQKVDVIFQNPPFGTKNEHADRVFLEVAVEHCDIVYTFHKSSTRRFVEAFFRENSFEMIKEFRFKFPIKRAFGFHRSVCRDIEVSCFRAERFKKEE